MKLKTVTEQVKEILQAEPSARNSDNVLYAFVLENVGKEKGLDINAMPVGTFLTLMKGFGIPSIETVGRVRRKVVETHPELAGTAEVEAGRTAQEEVFREYARKVNV